MSEDDPQQSRNPFIRFKRHVDSRIGTGLSTLTGSSNRTQTEAATAAAAMDPFNNAQLNKADRLPSSAPASSWEKSLAPQQAFHDYVSRMLHWKDWAYLSPYSPYNLRHLPPPVPVGVPPLDAHLFDFQDAFEDLLSVSSGQGLIDLRQQAARKRSIYDTFHSNEPPILWVAGLTARNLLPKPEPVAPPSGILFDLEMENRRRLAEAHQENASQRPLASGAIPGFEALHAVFNREDQIEKLQNFIDGALEELQDLRDSAEEQLDRDFIFNPAKMLRQAAVMLKSLDHVNDAQMDRKERSAAFTPEDLADDEFNRFLHDDNSSAWARLVEGKQAAAQQTSRPDTEEDFFSSIFGALTSKVDESPRTESPAVSPRSNDATQSRRRREQEIVEHDVNGTKTVTKSSEHVDMFGLVHEWTEVRKIDAHGKQISCDTKTVIRSPDKQLPKSAEPHVFSTKVSHDETDEAPKGGEGKSSGWFWR